jgi:hypothetical protein
MEIVLWILIVILGLVALFYRSKAIEYESLFELSKKYEANEDVVDEIGRMMEIQGAHGNWNYDAYMHGMYNGMEFCHSLVKGVEPKYRKAPKKWLADVGVNKSSSSKLNKDGSIAKKRGRESNVKTT